MSKTSEPVGKARSRKAVMTPMSRLIASCALALAVALPALVQAKIPTAGRSRFQ